MDGKGGWENTSSPIHSPKSKESEPLKKHHRAPHARPLLKSIILGPRAAIFSAENVPSLRFPPIIGDEKPFTRNHEVVL